MKSILRLTTAMLFFYSFAIPSVSAASSSNISPLIKYEASAKTAPSFQKLNKKFQKGKYKKPLKHGFGIFSIGFGIVSLLLLASSIIAVSLTLFTLTLFATGFGLLSGIIGLTIAVKKEDKAFRKKSIWGIILSLSPFAILFLAYLISFLRYL